MKAWVLSKLLWNSELNTDSLVNDFICGYYGKAAPSIRKYYDLCQDLVKQDTHMGCHIKGTNKIFTDKFISDAEPLIQTAYAQSENKKIKHRVKMVDLQILYLKFVRNRVKSFTDGTYARLLQIMKEERPYINEAISAEDFINKQGYI